MCINLTGFVESGWTRNLRILHSPLSKGEWTGTQAEADTNVGAIKVKYIYENRSHNNQARNSSQHEQKPKSKYFKRNNESKSNNSCTYCGKIRERGQCPAYGKVCSACGKLNHFIGLCHYKHLVQK